MTMNLMTMKMNVSSSSTFTHFTRKYPHIINPRSMININHHNPANTVQMFQTHLKPPMPKLHHLHALPENNDGNNNDPESEQNNNSSLSSSISDKIRKFLETLKTALVNQPVYPILFFVFIMLKLGSHLYKEHFSFTQIPKLFVKLTNTPAKQPMSLLLSLLVLNFFGKMNAYPTFMFWILLIRKYLCNLGIELYNAVFVKDVLDFFPNISMLKPIIEAYKINPFVGIFLGLICFGAGLVIYFLANL